MKRILSFLIVLGQIPVNAQQISGKITNPDQEALSYVSVGIIGMDRGTISNRNGTFHMDISDVGDEKIMKFSFVGYESTELKIGELKAGQTDFLNITLKKANVQIQEVIVKPKIWVPGYIGAKRAGKKAWIWSRAIHGAEIGTLFRNDKTILLDKFYFHVKKNYCDSILYRVRIYKGEDEFPRELLNRMDIRFVSKAKKGWDIVDLSDYNITTDRDFIITLETLESWTSRKYRTTHLSLENVKGALSYSKAASMSHWLEFSGQMSFRIGIKEYVNNESISR